MKSRKFFTNTLLEWNNKVNTRQMPWKGEKDPYRIWISEIILQQTRVQQGLEYYNRFIKKFPDVHSLAGANEQHVYKIWEGLGYYSRCRNLITSAKHINDKLDGKFPQKYNDILALKGVGNYTAAAIASFAFNLPYAVVDGNVFRVLARFLGIETAIDSHAGKKLFTLLAQKLIDLKNPGTYNQAIMDFGAVICKPLQPLCGVCPLNAKCFAYKKNMVSSLPVKEKRVKQSVRFFHYLIIEYKNKYYVHQRTAKDIWQNLYEFILIETESMMDEQSFLQLPAFLFYIKNNNYTLKKVSAVQQQKLTHQTINGKFYHINLKKEEPALKQYAAFSLKELMMLPFPKFITAYLKDSKYL